ALPHPPSPRHPGTSGAQCRSVPHRPAASRPRRHSGVTQRSRPVHGAVLARSWTPPSVWATDRGGSMRHTRTSIGVVAVVVLASVAAACGGGGGGGGSERSPCPPRAPACSPA